jgi:hypothetical protein
MIILKSGSNRYSLIVVDLINHIVTMNWVLPVEASSGNGLELSDNRALWNPKMAVMKNYASPNDHRIMILSKFSNTVGLKVSMLQESSRT